MVDGRARADDGAALTQPILVADNLAFGIVPVDKVPLENALPSGDARTWACARLAP